MVGDAVMLIVKTIKPEDIKKHANIYDGKVDRSVWHQYIFGNEEKDRSLVKKITEVGNSYHIVRTTYIGYVKELPKRRGSDSFVNQSYDIDWHYRFDKDDLLPGEKDRFNSIIHPDALLCLREMATTTPEKIIEEVVNNNS